MKLAFNSKHPFVPNPSKDINASRWIASLSDGSTVFEDITPYEKSSWCRLRDYIILHNLQLTNLRLEAYGNSLSLMPYRDDNNNPQINGYWYSKKIGALLTDDGVFETLSVGIGYVKGLHIYITWLNQDGNIGQEIRPYEKDNVAVIINDHPI